jgi:excisionase family DNA binding protein
MNTRAKRSKAKRPADADVLLSIEEIAAHCGVSESTINRMVRDGQFPAPQRFGRRLRKWSARQFNAWVEAGCPHEDAI